MGKSSGICVLVGAIVGAAATYVALQNKDKIAEKFHELEEKVEDKLSEKGITVEHAKELLDRANKVAHSSIEKLTELIHSKGLDNMDKEHILAEIKALKEKITNIGH